MGISKAVISKVWASVKSSDLSANNDNTLNIDTSFGFSGLKNGTYIYNIAICVKAENATPGFRYTLVKDSTSSAVRWGGVRPAYAVTPDNSAVDKINLLSHGFSVYDVAEIEAETSNGVWIYLNTTFTVTNNNGLIAFAWSQNTAHASNTTVCAGSYDRLEKIS